MEAEFTKNHIQEFQDEKVWRHESENQFVRKGKTHWTLCSTEFLLQNHNLNSDLYTEPLRNRHPTWTQDKEVPWMWHWRCGGASLSRRKLWRRKEFQQDSPHTLLLCERKRRKRGRCMFLCSCARQSKHNWSRSDSRTDCWLQTHTHPCFLSFSLLCNSRIWKRLLSTPPPSNSDQPDHLCTAADDTHRICLEDPDTTEAPSQRSPSCCRQTASGSRSLCLCRLWGCRSLTEKQTQSSCSSDEDWFDSLKMPECELLSWIKYLKKKSALTLPQTWSQPLDSSWLRPEKRGEGGGGSEQLRLFFSANIVLHIRWHPSSDCSTVMKEQSNIWTLEWSICKSDLSRSSCLKVFPHLISIEAAGGGRGDHVIVLSWPEKLHCWASSRFMSQGVDDLLTTIIHHTWGDFVSFLTFLFSELKSVNEAASLSAPVQHFWKKV